MSSESEVSRKKSGSEFQTIGPATENARRPKLERHGRLTCQLDDHNLAPFHTCLPAVVQEQGNQEYRTDL